MKALIGSRWWHLYKYGHSIQVNRTITVPLASTDKGWLFTCECGKVWAV